MIEPVHCGSNSILKVRFLGHPVYDIYPTDNLSYLCHHKFMPIKKCKTLPKFISGQEVRDLISFQWDPVVSCPLCYLERVAAVKWSEVPTTSSASKNGCTILGDKSPTSSNRATLSQNNLQRLQTKPKWKGKAKVKRIRDRKTHDQALLAGVAKPRRGVVGGSRGRQQ